jgi:hypothetical protein
MDEAFGREEDTMGGWRGTASALMLLGALLAPAAATGADWTVEVPVLAAIQENDRGVFTVLVLTWDRRPAPDPLELHWGNRRITVKGEGLDAIGHALAYALSRSSGAPPTGTITLYGASYAPVGSDGPSAGAVMTVGFLALLRGDQIRRGIALTGTIEAGGRIGPVGAIADKIRSAVREGCRTVLIPDGQLYDTRWDLPALASSLGVSVKEVGTIDEAYELMTGRRL